MDRRGKCLLLLGALLWSTLAGVCSVRRAEAYTKVSTFRELKKACEKQGEDTIELLNDVSIEGPVVIRGDKKILGNGYRLERSKAKGRIYGGCMFLVQGGDCQWKNVIVSGGGKSKNLSGNVFGRLVEIRRGSMVIGDKCVFCDNVNDRLAVDGGGAVRIGSKGVCTMRAGEIRNNQNVSRGAAFLIERGGCLTMKGGSIRNNKVTGAGAVKGFDGRGGAIYSEGKVTIEGGSIAGNRSYAYQEGGVRYGGMGAAVYADAGSNLYINGGVFTDNQDDQHSPFWIKGQVALGGRPVLERIYLSSRVYIRTRDSFCPRGRVWVHPENCRSGVCIVKGKRAPFELVADKQYKLVRRQGCFFLEKIDQVKKKQKAEEVPEPSPSSAKRKIGKPEIYCKPANFVFYVGEMVDRKVMLHGVRGEDPEEGDITKNVKIIQPKQEHLATDRERCGQILYEVRNKRGVKAQKKISYQIKKNRPPMIRTAPRFLFVSEVAGYTMQQWKRLLLQECKLSDDCDSIDELQYAAKIKLNQLAESRAGIWDAELTVQDQYGHRFYMKQGEKRRYGRGAKTVVKIPVTLVDDLEVGRKDAGYVRFTEPGAEDGVVEEWSFTADQIKKVRVFMDRREDPFGRETNQKFLHIFGECKRNEEDACG